MNLQVFNKDIFLLHSCFPTPLWIDYISNSFFLQERAYLLGLQFAEFSVTALSKLSTCPSRNELFRLKSKHFTYFFYLYIVMLLYGCTLLYYVIFKLKDFENLQEKYLLIVMSKNIIKFYIYVKHFSYVHFLSTLIIG